MDTFSGKGRRAPDGDSDISAQPARSSSDSVGADTTSDASLRMLIDSCADAVLIVDGEGLLRFINPAGERLFGRPPEQMVGQPFGFPLSAGETSEIQIIGRDGKALSAEMRCVQTLWDNRRAMLATIRETTQRKQAEEAIRALNAELERRIAERTAELEAASRAKDQFLAVLSHELRTPLTPVLLMVSALQQNPGLPQDIAEDLELIRHNVELEARLIDDLLDLTRITRGKLPLRREPVDAHHCISRAVEMSRGEIRTKQQNLSMKLDAQRPVVHADAARLQQVFWNLIKNAVKFTPIGGNVNVRSSNNSSGQLVVEISDTGIGVEPEVLPKLFRPFEQGDPAVMRQFGGLGLGLVVTKAIVESHGGKITAHSDGRDRGTRFVVQIPTVPAPQEVIITPEDGHASDQPNRNGNGNGNGNGDGDGNGAHHALAAHKRPKRILLVEDHESTLRIMAKLLECSDYRVTTASSIATALALIRDGGEFDFVLSDVGLPDGTGHELMRRIRQLRPGIVGIAFSGFGTDQDVTRSIDAGFAAHLTKPLDMPKIQAAIARAMSA